MKPTQVRSGGKVLHLDRLLGKGGEGEVYFIQGDPKHAVKIYTDKDRLSRENKIAAMVRCDLAKNTPLAAFPVAVAHHQDGSFAGFIMKLMGGHRALHELYAPGSRKHHFPRADYRFLARTATNIAKAFASVHQSGCVIGDVNHSVVLVSDQATVALIDTDSFQFSDGAHRYLCKVGVPEYTPPELQGRSFQGVVRTPDHDAFGLAVLMFQVLMMGRHPFVGTVRRGDIPPLHENIENFRYAYTDTRDVGMDQPPATPSLADFSPEIARLLDRAFSKESVGKRPTAADWVSALERFEQSLVQCADNPLHYGPKDASECAWCEMERQLNTFLFLPYVPAGAASAPLADPGQGFKLDAIWARIERVSIPSAEQLRPRIPKLSPLPTPAAVEAKKPRGHAKKAFGVLLLLIGGFILIAVPKAWFVAGLFAMWSYGLLKSVDAHRFDPKPFVNEFIGAQGQLYREILGWQRRAGLDDVNAARGQLVDAKQRYAELDAEEQRLVSEYRFQRRQRQLTTYLEAFELSRADIKGIGPAKLAVLESYGIDSAAEVSPSRLHIVPGFGEALIGRLMQWRRVHEAGFVYNASDNDADRQEVARIRALKEGKAAPLRLALTNGIRDLEVKVQRIHEFALREDAVLAKVVARVEQARADLIYLGVAVPTVAAPPAPRASQTSSVPAHSPRSTSQGHFSTPLRPAPSPASAPYQAPSRTALPDCPRCGSGMHQRLARRGRNAGSYFWGCSRYPSCKGTRPI